MDINEYSDGEYETDSQEEVQDDSPIGILRDAANFGVSVDGVEASKRVLSGENDEGNEMPHPRPAEPTAPSFPREDFKVTARMAEQGRKMVQEKLQGAETAKKVQLYNEIVNYYTYFPHIKEGAIRKKITPESPLTVLLEERLRIERELNTGNVLETVRQMDIFAHYGMEIVLTNIFNLPVQGLQVEARLTQQMMDQELKEFAVKYAHWFSSGPEWRYTQKILQRIFLIVRRNQSMGHPNMPTGDISENAQNKYSHL